MLTGSFESLYCVFSFEEFISHRLMVYRILCTILCSLCILSTELNY